MKLHFTLNKLILAIFVTLRWNTRCILRIICYKASKNHLKCAFLPFILFDILRYVFFFYSCIFFFFTLVLSLRLKLFSLFETTLRALFLRLLLTCVILSFFLFFYSDVYWRNFTLEGCANAGSNRIGPDLVVFEDAQQISNGNGMFIFTNIKFYEPI